VGKVNMGSRKGKKLKFRDEPKSKIEEESLKIQRRGRRG